MAINNNIWGSTRVKADKTSEAINLTHEPKAGQSLIPQVSLPLPVAQNLLALLSGVHDLPSMPHGWIGIGHHSPFDICVFVVHEKDKTRINFRHAESLPVPDIEQFTSELEQQVMVLKKTAR